MKKHRKNCECCPVSPLIVRKQRLLWIQVLNCQKFNHCLKCHKSLGSLLEDALWMYLSSSLSLSLSFSSRVMYLHHSDQIFQRSQLHDSNECIFSVKINYLEIDLSSSRTLFILATPEQYCFCHAWSHESSIWPWSCERKLSSHGQAALGQSFSRRPQIWSLQLLPIT